MPLTILLIQIIQFIAFIEMNNSDLFAASDTRLRNFIRQYSGYLKQNHLQNLYLTQSSHPAQMYNLSQPNDILLNEEFRRGSDVPSLIEQLMNKKEMVNTMKANNAPSNVNNANINYNPARPVLVNTQQRIFQEVINLLLEINQIKEAIQKEKDLTLQMEVERDNLLNKGNGKAKGKKFNDFEMESIISKLKSKEGDELKISVAQLEKFAAENEQLERNINRLKIKSKGNLKQVLEEQKQRYKALKKKLEQKNNEPSPALTGSNVQVLNEIKRLQADIERLQIGVQDGSSIGFQIKKLNEENLRLRQKTMSLIKEQEQGIQQSREEEEERRRLEEYIRQEEQNKIYFFEDLKQFKKEYESLKQENEELKRRLKGNQDSRKYQVPSSHNIPKHYTNTYNAGGYSYGDDNKFIKYQDLMAEMNTVMKQE